MFWPRTYTCYIVTSVLNPVARVSEYEDWQSSNPEEENELRQWSMPISVEAAQNSAFSRAESAAEYTCRQLHPDTCARPLFPGKRS